MRFLGLVLALSLATTASADKRIVDMTPGYERELASCEMQEGGLSIVLGKTRAFVATNPPEKAELDKDIERLAKGHELVALYCADVRAMVELLKANATTAYKSVAKAISAQDTAVRKSRRDGKKHSEELAAITRKLIPIVNARVAQATDRRATGKFPSGRAVLLPALTGSWKLGGNVVTDIAELATPGVAATVTTRPFPNGTCDEQRATFVARAGDEPVADVERTPEATAINVAWTTRYVRRDQTPHMLTMMCVAAGTGGFIALSDVTPAELTIADELTNLMVTMLATRPRAN